MSELKQKALRGVRWTTFSAGIAAAGGLVQTFALPRLLEPQDFALIAIVNVALGLSNQLVDMGFSNAILRDNALERPRLNSYYWANVILGCFLAVLIWTAAPLIAAFFPKLDGAKLCMLLHWLSPAFLISGFTMQYQTLLQKSLRFKTLAIIESMAFVISFGAIIGLAAGGFGVWSLVFGALLKTGLNAAGLLVTGFREHRPAWQFSWADIRPVWQFGAYQSLEKTIAYTAINLDTLLVARLFPPLVSGSYEVSKRLLIQPWYVINPIVTKVMYPVMAQVHRDLPRLRNIALRSIQLVALLNTPIYIACALGASLIVPTLFGGKWTEAIEPFRWLAIAYLVRAVLNPLGSVILAKGKGLLAFNMQAGTFIALLLAIMTGAYYGLPGMLFALCAFNLLLIIPCHYYIAKPLLGTNLRDLWEQVKIELGLSLAAFVLSGWAAHWLGTGWISLGVYLALGSSLYLYGLFRLRTHLLDDLRQMIPR